MCRQIYAPEKVISLQVIEFYRLYRDCAQVRPSWGRERVMLRYFLACLGDLDLTAITARHVDSWRSARRLAVADQSVDREFSAVCSMMTKAVEWGYLAESPCTRLHRFGGSNPRYRTLDRDEVAAIMSAAIAAGPLVYFIIRTLHDTGMRPGELRTLSWSQIDFKDSVFRLSRTKTGKGRIIYLTPSVLAATAALPRSIALVCAPWPRKRLDAVCAAIHNFRLYDLRKNFITKALEQGADVSVVARSAGCSAATILKFYASPGVDQVRDCFMRATLYERSGVQLQLVHERRPQGDHT